MPTLRDINPVLDERWLGRAAFWVRHREQLRILILGLIMFVDGILVVYSGYWWIDAYVLSYERERQMIAELTGPFPILAAHGVVSPIPLPPPLAVTLPGSTREGSYDALVKFVNPNTNWLATVRYRVIGDTVGPEQTITVLNKGSVPADNERLAVIPAVTRSASSSPRVEILGTVWKRLRNPDEFNAMKPQFTVSGVEYTSAAALSGAGNLAVNQVHFTVANESIFSSWSVEFTVIVRQGSREIAASHVTVDEFKSNEQRQVSVNFFGPIGSGATAIVVPFVDVADERSFMRLPGQPIEF